uniref:CARDB domain-containing protein n=1 Tax=Thermodesulfobacterium geofontis TaxID=1295609 RepID=A0A7V6CEC4_9BACT
MKKIFFLGIILLGIFFFSSYILAQDIHIDIDVACPSNVKIGKALNITVEACNEGTYSVTLKRGVTGLLANSPSSNPISNVSVYGPYFRNFAANPWNISPGQCINRTVKVLNSVPQELAGTVGMVFFQFFDQSGHGIDGDGCQVPIVP